MAEIIQFPNRPGPGLIDDAPLWQFVSAVGAYFGWRERDIMTAQLLKLDQIAADYENVMASLPESPARAGIEDEIARARDHISRLRETLQRAHDEAIGTLRAFDCEQAARS